MSRPRTQQGSATLLVVAFAGVLLLVGSALGVVSAMVLAHRAAQSGADLAALAGAQALAGGGDACTEATDVAAANGVRMEECLTDGADVTVTVEAPGPHWLDQTADLSARARAGPG